MPQVETRIYLTANLQAPCSNKNTKASWRKAFLTELHLAWLTATWLLRNVSSSAVSGVFVLII
jgi:hypothetical protein